MYVKGTLEQELKFKYKGLSTEDIVRKIKYGKSGTQERVPMKQLRKIKYAEDYKVARDKVP